MIFNVKKLNTLEKEICLKTISSKAVFAITGDAILNHESISIVRMGDGERRILESDKALPFTAFEDRGEWNKQLGIEGMPTEQIQKNILDAGNNCTYFAPSVSGISLTSYYLYNYFAPRPFYFDNFFVNDWTFAMIKMLFETSDGIFVMHRDYKEIIDNFRKTYSLSDSKRLAGFPKNDWRDNNESIKAAIDSGMQLILFSAGPGGKIIAPEIAKAKNKIVLDVGNTLMPWSIKTPK